LSEFEENDGKTLPEGFQVIEEFIFSISGF
jgi:hypothetical protein